MEREYLSKLLMPYAFQPICRLSDGSIFGYEALMRPGGMGPEAFLKAADIAHSKEASHTIELTTIFSALTLFDEWEGHKLFINSFPNECLSDSEFTGILSIFGKEKMSHLVVELLEYPYLDMESCMKKREQIHEAGCLFAIDDFGTGIADIDLVHRLSPDIVKLDRRYIEQSRLVGSDRAVWLDSFLSDIVKWGADVVIEGIETEEDLSASSASLASFGQGYYFARPRLKKPESSGQVYPFVLPEEGKERNVAT